MGARAEERTLAGLVATPFWSLARWVHRPKPAANEPDPRCCSRCADNLRAALSWSHYYTDWNKMLADARQHWPSSPLFIVGCRHDESTIRLFLRGLAVLGDLAERDALSTVTGRSDREILREMGEQAREFLRAAPTKAEVESTTGQPEDE